MSCDMYFCKLPKEASVKDTFYLLPVSTIPRNPSKPWFMKVPVGKNTLGNMVKEICKDGNISGNKTNHSLRATGASNMFQAGVPEKIIQQWTGHRSLPGLRQYERTTIEQQQAVCRVLSSTKKEEFQVSVSGEQKYNTAPVPTLASAPTYNFHGCSVVITQGCCVPPTPPPPPPPPPGASQPPQSQLDFDIEAFLADL